MQEGIRKLWRSVSMGGLTRMKQHSLLNPGFKYKGENQEIGKYLYRMPRLEILSRYMENIQYQHLADWDGNLINQQNDNRKTQPKKVYPLPEISADIFSGLLTSAESRLKITVEDEDVQDQIDVFLKKILFWACVKDAFYSFYSNGSLFIRFYVTPDNKKIILEPYNTKSCWPLFDENDELESVKIRYVYDTGEVDPKHRPIWRWAQYEFTKESDIEYDQPIFDWDSNKLPKFTVESQFDHDFGFVQGEWIKNGFNPSGDDGKSLLEPALDYIDDFNYMSSKESNAIFHALYPTMVGFGVDSADFENSMKSLLYSKEISGGSSVITTTRPPDKADLRFLEGTNAGPTLSDIYQQRSMQILQQILRISLPNPEVIVGYAQSAEAMKMLYRPVIEEIKKMRDFLEYGLCNLLTKLEIASQKVPFGIPLGTIEEAKKEWGEMFTATETDKTQRVASVVQAYESRIISRETATRHVSQDFKIQNIEEEIQKIEEDEDTEREKDIMSFKAESDIEAKNNPPTKPAPKKPAPKK